MTALTAAELADRLFTEVGRLFVEADHQGDPAVDYLAPALQVLIDERVILPVDLDEKHQVEFTENGWVMQHPLLDRLNGTLFSCDYNQVAGEQYRDGPPERVMEAGPSTWTVELSGDGETLRLLERLA